MNEKDNKKKIIYVCTQGDYSDYHIAGVFDDEKLARKFAAHFHCEVEEWPLNPFELELRNDYFPYFVRMSKDGKVIDVYREESDYGFQPDEKRYGPDIHGNLYNKCWAKNKEHAIKITNEKRAQLLAMNQWPKPKQWRKQ